MNRDLLYFSSVCLCLFSSISGNLFLGRAFGALLAHVERNRCVSLSCELKTTHRMQRHSNCSSLD